jgi:ribonuclease HI
LAVWGPDPDSLVEEVNVALNQAKDWATGCGLEFSAQKTSAILFHRKRIPLTPAPPVLGGLALRWEEAVTYLGVKVTHNLRWGPHIRGKVESCRGMLMALSRVTRTLRWPSPMAMRLAYQGIVVPALLYASHVWATALKGQLQKQLERLQRLALLAIAAAPRSCPTAGMEVLLNLPPLDLLAIRRASAAYHRIRGVVLPPLGRGQLLRRSHMGMLEVHLEGLTPQVGWDSCIPVPNCKQFTVTVRADDNRLDAPHGSPDITVHTDGSGQDGRIGVGYLIQFNHSGEERRGQARLGSANSVFQAEVTAICCAAESLRGLRGQHVLIRSDSQAALQALAQRRIFSGVVQGCTRALNNLARDNRVALRWVKAHIGLAGNEEADRLAKAGRMLPRESQLPYPVSRLREGLDRNLRGAWEGWWAALQQCRQTKLWISRPGSLRLNNDQWKRVSRGDLRTLIQVVTGHGPYMRHKALMTPGTNPVCRRCRGQVEETPWHLVTECPALCGPRVRIFGRPFFRSLEEITPPFVGHADPWTSRRLLAFASAAGLDRTWTWGEEVPWVAVVPGV